MNVKNAIRYIYCRKFY